MKATELMIGDWILTGDNQPVQVVGLTVDSIETTAKEGYYYEFFFSPIPLSQEILEKNGFEMKNDNKVQELYNMLDGDTIYYVHELQHALQLFGVEKTITI